MKFRLKFVLLPTLILCARKQAAMPRAVRCARGLPVQDTFRRGTMAAGASGAVQRGQMEGPSAFSVQQVHRKVKIST